MVQKMTAHLCSRKGKRKSENLFNDRPNPSYLNIQLSTGTLKNEGKLLQIFGTFGAIFTM